MRSPKRSSCKPIQRLAIRISMPNHVNMPTSLSAGSTRNEACSWANPDCPHCDCSRSYTKGDVTYCMLCAVEGASMRFQKHKCRRLTARCRNEKPSRQLTALMNRTVGYSNRPSCAHATRKPGGKIDGQEFHKRPSQ